MSTTSNDKPHIPREDWIAYQANPDKAFPKRVLEVYGYIPRTTAYRFARKKPRVLDVEDLIQAGNEGLLQAMERYNPDAKAQFNTFATIRVRGAILDQINKVDWTPRQVRERIKPVIKVFEKLGRNAQESTPADAEIIAEHIADMTVEEAETVLGQIRKTYISHIDKDVMSALSGENMLGVGNQNGIKPEIRTIMNLVLDFKERSIIELKFFWGYKDYEIAEKLEISQHQLNRLERSALEKLRHNLSEDDFTL